jgi:nicotinamidase-related amidase
VDPEKTALILIGYQNDYFAEDGILRSAIEESAIANNALANTITLLSILRDTPVLLASTPIVFTPDYSELIEPVGILKAIVDHQAFRAGEKGCEVIPEIRAFGDRINELPGKRGLNAFSNTGLDPLLKKSGITTVVLAGAVTSICIDSTGRSAFDRDYKVIMLSNCTTGRTVHEQNFYCESIFPLYAAVMDHTQLVAELGVAA